MKKTITITMLLVVVFTMVFAMSVQADEFTYHPDFVLVPAYIELDMDEYMEVPYLFLNEFATDNIDCKAIYVQFNGHETHFFVKKNVNPKNPIPAPKGAQIALPFTTC